MPSYCTRTCCGPYCQHKTSQNIICIDTEIGLVSDNAKTTVGTENQTHQPFILDPLQSNIVNITAHIHINTNIGLESDSDMILLVIKNETHICQPVAVPKVGAHACEQFNLLIASIIVSLHSTTDSGVYLVSTLISCEMIKPTEIYLSCLACVQNTITAIIYNLNNGRISRQSNK